MNDKCEVLGHRGTFIKYKVNNRYIVYLHNYANCQNIVIDTKKNNKDITLTKEGQHYICIAYCMKNQ